MFEMLPFGEQSRRVWNFVFIYCLALCAFPWVWQQYTVLCHFDVEAALLQECDYPLFSISSFSALGELLPYFLFCPCRYFLMWHSLHSYDLWPQWCLSRFWVKQQMNSVQNSCKKYSLLQALFDAVLPGERCLFPQTRKTSSWEQKR